MTDTFLVKTDHGDVVVVARDDRGGLDPDFLRFEVPTPETTAGLTLEVPLRAFAAKMVELIEARGGDLPGGERMRRMMIQEKATADLKRIERWSERHAAELAADEAARDAEPGGP